MDVTVAEKEKQTKEGQINVQETVQQGNKYFNASKRSNTNFPAEKCDSKTTVEHLLSQVEDVKVDLGGLRKKQEKDKWKPYSTPQVNAEKQKKKVVSQPIFFSKQKIKHQNDKQRLQMDVKVQEIRNKIQSDYLNSIKISNQQNKHIKDTDMYNAAVKDSTQYNPSYLTIDKTVIPSLIARYAGKGTLVFDKHESWAHQEIITNYPKEIGVSVSVQGKEYVTNQFKIHYSMKKGIHIVPFHSFEIN
jgi:hypothetical protein